MIKRVLKGCWIFIAVFVIFMAVVSSIFRALTPWAIQYKPEVEAHLSQLLGTPVTIDAMETGWYWFEPVIKLNDIKINNDNKSAIELNKLSVGINLFSSLWHWQIQPGILSLDNLHLTLRQLDGHWQIEGIEDKNTQVKFDKETYLPLLTWLLAQQKIIIKHLSTDIYFQDGTSVPIEEFNLAISRRYSQYTIKGVAHLAQSDSSLQFLANTQLDLDEWQQSKGDAYIALENINLSEWQHFLTFPQGALNAGQGTLQFWFDWRKGKITQVQSRVSLKEFVAADTQTNTRYALNPFNANIAWQANKQGWQLTADHLNIGLNNVMWPENQLIVRHNKVDQSWFVYSKYLLIESLLAAIPDDYQPLAPVRALKPHGELHETQVHIQQGAIAYVLTKFQNLAWQSPRYPSVANLSGVLHWQPTEGQLELDSENMQLTAVGQQPITLTQLNAAVDWKALSRGFRVSMDRLVIEHPDLIISASGMADEVARDNVGQINLVGQVSAKNAQQWLAYIPTGLLKIKLEHWLKQDIKKIEQLAAEVTVNGQAHDFPYDQQPGTFLINGHVSGVDLIFAPDWPISQNIEADIKMDKRLLEANISHANLKANTIDNGNLRVEGIGLDHEVLLFHSMVQTQAQDALAYIKASPLIKKIATLNMLRIQGPIRLDLRLEAPLYPENDDVLALGDLNFKHDQLVVKHAFQDIHFNELNGSLQFDQDGILDSSMDANVLGYPITLLVKSIHTDKPYTQIKINGRTTIDVLRKQFQWPLLALMQGNLWLECLLMFTDDPKDLDHLSIKTSLQGMSLNLPAPLGKKASEKTPLTVDIDFNPAKGVNIQFNYADKLSSYLAYITEQGKLHFETGEVHLGNDKELKPTIPGLHVTGHLDEFNLSEWQYALKSLPKASSESSLSDSIQSMDVVISRALIGSHIYPDVAINAKKLSNNQWSIAIKQPFVVGELVYNPADNFLRGTLKTLKLKKIPQSAKTDTLSDIKISSMPSLDIKINQLQVNDLPLGMAEIQAIHAESLWTITGCKISTPYYVLSAHGQWQEKDGKEKTQFEGSLSITQLAKSLERWHITPAVDAHEGLLQFQVDWPGGIQDFSFKHLSGQTFISLKDGQITHLGAGTENKLGLGKLLSILSLQTIPRRLKLDFSDLSNDGYSFDEFKGGFKISKGLMTTQDSYIDGPVARATMKGHLDMARQLYDLNIKIFPHVTASLPIVATIAGGPIAGLATWVVSKIITSGMQEISGYTYKITGSWEHPVVQQVSIIKKTFSP